MDNRNILYDNRKYIGFKFWIKLNDNIIGKIIYINDVPTNYAICENGNVINIKTLHVLKPGITNKGYKYVNIQLGKTGKYKSLTIHRLLALAFIENPYNKPIVNHIDGNKLNLDLSNLEWATYSENNIHAFKFGLKTPHIRKSEDCNLTTHTKEQVIVVCEMLEKGFSPKIINKKYNYGYDFIMNIYKGITWKAISKNYNIPKVKKHSNIFTTLEIEKMHRLFDNNKTVKEVIDIMGWEYTEQLRGNVKYIKKRHNEHREGQLKSL